MLAFNIIAEAVDGKILLAGGIPNAAWRVASSLVIASKFAKVSPGTSEEQAALEIFRANAHTTTHPLIRELLPQLKLPENSLTQRAICVVLG